MSDDPVYLRVVSLHLSRTLDEIGLNALTVINRRSAFLFRENANTVFSRLTGRELRSFHFGSQTEGATTPGIASDLDTLACYDGFNIIQDWPEWGRGKENLLMLQDNTAPGYCRLQVLRSDIPIAREDLPRAHCTYDSSGRVLLNNTCLNTPVPGLHHARNGPARSRSGSPSMIDTDFVVALHCRSWPIQAEEFTRRQRRRGWPSEGLLQQVVRHGVFLVPVGSKLSSKESFEWRISASSAERCLMFSLNIVQIKCYAVLKMLMKTFVEPRVRKCISSYHCKTAVLYCTENTDPGFWRDNNLLQCLTVCLMTLLAWVTTGFCPQFIIAAENLFAGKVTAGNRGILQSILTYLIKSNGRALLRVHIDDLGHMLLTKLNTIPSVVPVLDSLATLTLIGAFEIDRHGCVDNCIKVFLIKNLNRKPTAVIRYVYKTIGMLQGSIGQSEKHERQAIQIFTEFLFCWMGSLLASVMLSHKMEIPPTVIQLLRIGANSNVGSMLKLASVFYCNGDVGKAEYILQKLEDRFCRSEIHFVCACYGKPYRVPLDPDHVISTLKDKKAPANFISNCVGFAPQEIHCTPHSLRSELFRSVGKDIQHRVPFLDDWMALAVVDCLPYMYYLQYLTFRQLGKKILRKRSLHNLDQCIREDNDFGHLETAWNLLGQCMELEQEPQAAIVCYRTSLVIRPRNNAANWHVAVLCYNLIQGRGLPV